MWDTVESGQCHLSHDLPCPRCGHEVHRYLQCGESCDCPPIELPGSVAA